MQKEQEPTTSRIQQGRTSKLLDTRSCRMSEWTQHNKLERTITTRPSNQNPETKMTSSFLLLRSCWLDVVTARRWACLTCQLSDWNLAFHRGCVLVSNHALVFGLRWHFQSCVLKDMYVHQFSIFKRFSPESFWRRRWCPSDGYVHVTTQPISQQNRWTNQPTQRLCRVSAFLR